MGANAGGTPAAAIVGVPTIMACDGQTWVNRIRIVFLQRQFAACAAYAIGAGLALRVEHGERMTGKGIA